MFLALGIWISPLMLLANEPAAGIVITKPSADAPNTRAGAVIEYATITDHLIPATDYITVNKPDGSQDLIAKNTIIMRVEYPRETPWNIFSDGMISPIALKIQELRQLAQQFPAAQKYLDPRIAALQKEVDLFNQGGKKLNGTWISAEDFGRLLTIERERRAAQAAAQKKAAEDIAEAIRKKEEQIAAETKRLADEEAAAEAKIKAEQAEAVAKKAKLAELARMKTKADALLKMPQKKAASNVPWSSIILVLVAGTGVVFGAKYFKTRIGVKSLSSLDWQKFELLVAEVYRRQGYSVEISAGFGTEHGVDVMLTRREEVLLIQCKHWKALKNYKVNAQEIQELSEAVAEAPERKGIFVSTGEYTKDAKEFVADKPITLLGPADIELMIPQIQRRNENIYDFALWINEFIDSSKIVDPVCPKCQKPMQLKRGRDGTPIWRCTDTQTCGGRLDARADLVKRRQF